MSAFILCGYAPLLRGPSTQINIRTEARASILSAEHNWRDACGMSRARMRVVVGALQAFDRDVRGDLRRGKARVA